MQACTSKDEAAEVLLGVATGQRPNRQPESQLTFGEYAEEWRRQRLHHRPSTATTTEGTFKRILLPSLGALPLVVVTRADIQAAAVAWSTRLAPSTVLVAYGYVAAVFKTAGEDRLVPFSPCVRINLPAKSREKVVPMTVEQVLAVADAVPAWYRTMVVAAASGLRGGELRGLTANRVGADGVIVVDRQLVDVRDRVPVFGPPKSAAGIRTVALGKVARRALDEHQGVYPANPAGLVWVNRMRTPVTRNDASDVWRGATKGMTLRSRSGWHDLRHFHASLLIGAGLSPRAVADRLGHADPGETLSTYAHL